MEEGVEHLAVPGGDKGSHKAGHQNCCNGEDNRAFEFESSWQASKTRAAAEYLPRRVARHAEKRRKNLQEKNPPSGSILHGPLHKALAKPKLAVRKDDPYVTVKKTGSEPTISDQVEFEDPAVAWDFQWKSRM